jgi:hypothetical protein
MLILSTTVNLFCCPATLERNRSANMLDYTRQRAAEVLRIPRIAVLATSGPAGMQVTELRCEAQELELFLLVPKTSDHLFNLEYDPNVTLLTAGWELKGIAHILSPDLLDMPLRLLREPEADWCMLVRVDPWQVHVIREGGWGKIETLDLY